jgi:hypothetical protein
MKPVVSLRSTTGCFLASLRDAGTIDQEYATSKGVSEALR